MVGLISAAYADTPTLPSEQKKECKGEEFLNLLIKNIRENSAKKTSRCLHGDPLFASTNLSSKEIDHIVNAVKDTIEKKDLISLCRDLVSKDNKFNLDDLKELTEERVRIEFAIKYALANKKISSVIHLFRISNQAVLVKIAKIAAAQEGGVISEHILNYGIKDLDRLAEIAEIAATQNTDDGWKISKYIKNFGPLKLDALTKIAKIAAARSGFGVSSYITNYGITDPDRLAEIAEIAAAQDPHSTSSEIRRYGITNRIALFKIALIAAAQDGDTTSFCIQNYGITDLEMLFEIAKVAAAQSGLGVSRNIKNFGFTDQKMLFVIAKIAAAQDGENTLKHFKNYGIVDSDDLWRIVIVALKQNLMGGLSQLKQFKLYRSELELLEEDYSHYSALNSLSVIKKEQPTLEPLTTFVTAALALETNPQIRTQLRVAYGAFLSLCRIKKIHPDRYLDVQPLMQSCLSLKEPALRLKLLWELTDLMACDPVWKSYQKAVNEVKNWAQLPYMLLAPYFSASPTLVTTIQKICSDKIFKDKLKNRTLIKYLHTFVHTDALSLEEKTTLLENVIFHKKHSLESVLEALKMISLLIDLGEAHLLPKLVDVTALFDLIAAQYRSKLDLEAEDLGKKIARTFLRQRNPMAILRYAADIKQDSQCLKLLKRCAASIIEDKFPAMRYDIKESPHLALLNEKCPEIFAKWKEGVDLSGLKNKESKQSEDPGLKFQKTFTTKILEDYHLDVKLYPFVKAVLDGSMERSKAICSINEALKGLEEKIGAAIQSDKELYQQHNLERLRLKFEKQQLLLFTPWISNERAVEILKELSRILSLLHKDKPPKLLADIEKIVKDISTQKQLSKRTLVLSDNFNDLTLEGSKAEGVCIRIGGDGKSNRCLLALIMDGKNKLLTIKNEEGEIDARSIVRLLWDSKAEKPVLFLERIYPSHLDEASKVLLLRGGKEIAKQLGNLPLLSVEEGSGSEYSGSVESLGGIAPYEYVDAIGKFGETARDSRFTIQGAKLLA